MRIHITAVAGTGMGSLAGLLKELGHDVSGSDTAFYPPMGPSLKEWGIRLLEGFDPAHLSPAHHSGESLDCVVVGNVCRKNNPEALEADALGIERLHIADALRRFALPGTSSLVVAGTHGKTTTSSLTAYLLDAAGLNPGFLIGGIPQSLGRSFRKAAPPSGGPARLDPDALNPARLDPARLDPDAPNHDAPNHDAPNPGRRRPPPFVLEGDEYDTAYWEKSAKFLHYQADVAILTSVEHDHIDIYPEFESYLGAFARFVSALPAAGLLVAFAGDAHVAAVAAGAKCPVIYYAVEGDAVSSPRVDVLAKKLEDTPEGTRFEFEFAGQRLGPFFSPLSGSHNLRNAVAALLAAHVGYGADLNQMGAALKSFLGIKRRQELLGTPGGVAVYDDFAHHPTAVNETLRALKSRCPQGRLIAIFEPRSATACRRLHQDDYPEAFSAADHVLLAPVGRPDLSVDERLDVEQVARELSARGTPAEALPTTDAILARTVELSRPGDLVAILSNGAFEGLHQRLLKSLAAPERIS